MGFATQIGNAIRSHHHRRITQVRFDVRFVDDELNADCAVAAFRREDQAHRFRHIDTALRGNVYHHPAFEFTKRWTTRDAYHYRQIVIDIVQIEILDHAATARGVGIHIQTHALPRRLRSVHQLERFTDLAPVRFSRGFVMGNVRLHASLAADQQRFFHSFQQAIAFVTHVGGVQRIERLRGAGEFNHFRRIAPTPRAIDEAR